MKQKIQWEIKADACILGAALVLLLPLRWWLAAGAAAAFHEACHGLAVRAFGGSIRKITIRASGIAMESDPLMPGQALACSLAGPVGELFLLLFARTFPRLAVCALLQAALNLLPVFPLDGGRALRNFLLLLLPEKAAEAAFRVVNMGTTGVLLLLAMAGFVRLQAKLLPLIALLFVFRSLWAKRTCKEGFQQLQ